MDMQPQVPVQPLAPAPSEGGKRRFDARRFVPWLVLALVVGILAWFTLDSWSKTWQEVDSYNATASVIIGRAKLASIQSGMPGNDILDPLPQFAFGHRFVCREILAQFRTDEMGRVWDIVRRHNAELASPALPGPRGWLVSVGGACTHEAVQNSINDFSADPDVVSVGPHYVGI